MNPRKFKRNLNKLMAARLKALPAKVVNGHWGTKPSKNRMVHGKATPMLYVVDVKSGKLMVHLPVPHFEAMMQKAGYRRQGVDEAALANEPEPSEDELQALKDAA